MAAFFNQKFKCTRSVLFLIYLFFFNSGVKAQLNNWTTFTAMREVVEFVELDGSIWAATTGGLLIYDISSERYQSFTNTSGLASNDISSISVDEFQRVWVAQSNGFIHIFNSATREIEDVISVFENTYIHNMLSVGDTMYISLNVGVSEYRIDRQESKEIYRQLGENIPEEIPVIKTLVLNNHLYAATGNGLSKAALSLTNLKAPQSWQTYSVIDGLPSNKIQDLAIYQGNILIATNAGLSQENDNGIVDFSAALPSKNIISLAVADDGGTETVYIATVSNIYSSNDLQSWNRLPQVRDSNNLISQIKMIDGQLWAAFIANGLVTSPFALARFDATLNEWRTFAPNGPKTRTFNSIAFDPNSGLLWAAAQGIMAYDGTQWYNFEDSDIFSKGDFRKVVIDKQGRKWFGHWGDGIFVLSGNPDEFSWQFFDQTDNRLSPISSTSGGDFVVVDEMAVDAAGNIWISNFIPASGRPIAVVDAGLQNWYYFSLAEGIRSPHIHSIIEDFRRPGWIWYGSGGVHAGHPGNGVGVIVHNNTLGDKSDDDYNQGFNTDEGLLSLDVRTVAQDMDGTMWFGTPDGLNFWLSGNVSQFRGIAGGDKLISTDIKVIRIDVTNNKWIGTSSGITVIAPGNNGLTHYTTDNSPIVSNDIKDITFNPENGDVYIATTQGLSILSTPFARPKKDFTQILGFPNPFIISDGSETFKFGNLMAESGIKIFAANGTFVRDFEPGAFSGATPEWDGRDENKQLVGSGVYFFIGYTENGDSGVGKIAVIRK